MGTVQDLRLAVRGLVRNRGFTAVAVLTLALGIGANTAIFSVLRAAILRPLPYPDAEALVAVGQSRAKGRINTVSYLDFVDWRRDTRSLVELAAWHDDQVTLTGGPRPARLHGVAGSANLLATLGLVPELGRGFAPSEDQPGKNRVVVLGHDAWLRHFAGDPAIVGATVTLDDQPFTVIGVLGPGARFPMRDDPVDSFVPTPRPWDEAMIPRRDAQYLSLVGRLAPGATVEAAQADLDAQAARQAAAYPADDANRFVTVRPLHGELVSGVRPALLVLFAAVGLVLLIACANVANLLLARASTRRHEIAVRLALGAGRWRVVRLVLVESLALSLLGAALGVLVALWGLDALAPLLPRSLSVIRDIRIDGGVLAFTLLAAAATGAVFGVLPALAMRAEPEELLREAAATSPTPARVKLREALVAGEIALAALLLVGAGLTLQGFSRLTRVDPGFSPTGLVTGNAFLPDGRYGKSAAQARFYRELGAGLEAIPGVEAAAVGFPLPFSEMNISIPYTFDGAPPPEQKPTASLHLVGPSWFRTLGIPIVAGRGFDAADDRAEAAPVVVVSRTFAARAFPGGDAVGKRITVEWNQPLSHEIVGVVGDVRTDGLHEPLKPEMYLPFGRNPFPFVTFALRAPGAAVSAGVLADAVQAIDPGLPVAGASTMTEALHASLSRQRLSTVLLAIFGAVALALAVIGVYGVMSYTVTQRRREIGLRLALGAGDRRVTRMIVGQALGVSLAGVAVGLLLSLALVRVTGRLLYGLASSSPSMFAVVAAVLLGIAALAAWLPARRAARIDPMVALR